MDESAFGVIHKGGSAKNAKVIANAARRTAEATRLGSSAATKVSHVHPAQRSTITVASWPHKPPTPNLDLGAAAHAASKKPTKAAYAEAAQAKAPGLSKGKLTAVVGLGAAGTGGAGYLANKKIYNR